MIIHMVMFKFGATTTEQQMQECMHKAVDLKNHISGIEQIVVGRNFSHRSHGFQIGLTVFFTNQQALEQYGPHPKHQELVSYLKEIGQEDIIVVDFENQA